MKTYLSGKAHLSTEVVLGSAGDLSSALPRDSATGASVSTTGWRNIVSALATVLPTHSWRGSTRWWAPPRACRTRLLLLIGTVATITTLALAYALTLRAYGSIACARWRRPCSGAGTCSERATSRFWHRLIIRRRARRAASGRATHVCRASSYSRRARWDVMSVTRWARRWVTDVRAGAVAVTSRGGVPSCRTETGWTRDGNRLARRHTTRWLRRVSRTRAPGASSIISTWGTCARTAHISWWAVPTWCSRSYRTFFTFDNLELKTVDKWNKTQRFHDKNAISNVLCEITTEFVLQRETAEPGRDPRDTTDDAQDPAVDRPPVLIAKSNVVEHKNVRNMKIHRF